MSVPWYDCESDFKAIVDLIPFQESIDSKDYKAWVEQLKILEAKAEQEGYSPYRVKITPASIKVWCEANDVLISRLSISNYARNKMIQEKGL